MNFKVEKMPAEAFIFTAILAYVGAKDILHVNNTIACGPDRPLVVNQRVGLVASPRYFRTYQANSNCSWIIKAPEGQAVFLKRMYFGLNIDGDYDFLYVSDGEPPHHKILRLYAFYSFSTYTSKSNVLYLHFVSGRIPRGLGFEFYFEQVGRPVICGSENFTCRHKTKCIPLVKKCDGKDDCGDGSDEEKCEDYRVADVKCGVPSIPPVLDADKVVGGQKAVPGSWPWQASLRLVADRPYGHQCGAVLIHPQWLLTAGHCFKYNKLDVKYWNVLLGKHFKLVPEDSEQLRYMEAIYIHPKYKGLNIMDPTTPWLEWKQHDLALVKLNAPVRLADAVSPVCLPSSNHSLEPGTLCYITGWGETYGTGFELELKQAGVPVVSLKKCREWNPNFDIVPSMICAGHEEGGHDSCQGDSGGPLVYFADGRWHLAGIVSTGSQLGGCADKKQPGIYTLVSYYTDWIRNVTGMEADPSFALF